MLPSESDLNGNGSVAISPLLVPSGGCLNHDSGFSLALELLSCKVTPGVLLQGHGDLVQLSVSLSLQRMLELLSYEDLHPPK